MMELTVSIEITFPLLFSAYRETEKGKKPNKHTIFFDTDILYLHSLLSGLIITNPPEGAGVK
jgi:hypothetical protein